MSAKEIDESLHSKSQNKTKSTETSEDLPKVPPFFDDSETQDLQKKGKSSSVSLYMWTNRELECIINTRAQLQMYDKVLVEKLRDAINKLTEIRKAIIEGSVSISIPSKYRDEVSYQKDLAKHSELLNKSASQSAEQIEVIMLMNQVPRLHMNPTFVKNPTLRDFEEQYNALPLHLKLCLLCFSVFPARAIIKKRLMVYWWIAEGFIEPGKDLEQQGAEYFDELIKKGFIKPCHDKRRLDVETCTIPPFIRSALITIASKARFFDFDPTGNPEAKCLSSFRSCLVGEKDLERDFDFEKFHLVFNVSETILDIRPEWIHRMKNVSVLYLGRWQSHGSHHIVVADEEFLKALGDMKHLRLLSLQGISGIVELPDQVTKLENLTILDLRACHSLVKIPSEIGLLRNLTHLDLSECYLLRKMPKGISTLKNLLVLKGFVVVESSTQSCTVMDLAKLPKLRKLSIFTVLKNFPDEDDLKAFQQLKKLAKLKIVWGGGSKKEGNDQMQNIDLTADIHQHKTEELVNNQETSRELQEPTLPNARDHTDTTHIPAAESDVVPAPEGDMRKAPQRKTTPSSKGSTLQDMAKLPSFCFRDSATSQNDTKIADNDAMNPETQVIDTQMASEQAEEREQVPAPEPLAKTLLVPATEGHTTKGPRTSMSNINSSSKKTAPEPSSKQPKQRRWKRHFIWRSTASKYINNNASKYKNNNAYSPQLPATLRKLDLQWFPQETAPYWLNPKELPGLEKLYIRGGQLCDLVGYTGGWNGTENPWKLVTTLRLRYLTGLAMHWKEVQKLFPELTYLEKVNCPKLIFFPCDEAGVWINKEKVEKEY